MTAIAATRAKVTEIENGIKRTIQCYEMDNSDGYDDIIAGLQMALDIIDDIKNYR